MDFQCHHPNHSVNLAMKPKRISTTPNLLHTCIHVSLALGACLLPSIHAADGTWTSTTDGIWGDYANWVGGMVAGGAGASASFTLSSPNNITIGLDSSRTVGRLNFHDADWSLSPQGFWHLSDGGNPANVLTLDALAATPVISVKGVGNADISAAIAGSAGFTKIGNGNLYLSGANLYTGTTTIQQGRIVLFGDGTLGNGADLVIGSDTPAGYGGSLDLGGNIRTVAAMEISGTGEKIINGTLIGTSYSIHNSGVDGSGNSGVASIISAGLGGVASLSKTGSGTTILSGTNTYSGTTTISGGTLQFAEAASLYDGNPLVWTPSNISVGNGATLAINVGGDSEFSISEAKVLLGNLTSSIQNNGLQSGSTFAIDTSNAPGPQTFDQVIQDSSGVGAGSLGFTKSGSGTLILNQANTHTGVTTVSGGTLSISEAGTLGNQNALTVLDYATLNLGGTSQTVGGVQINGGTIANGNLVGSSYTIGEGSATVSASLGGIGASLAVNGGVTLSAVNTYTGDTTISGGSLTISGSGTLGTNSNLNVADGVLNLGGTSQVIGSVVLQDANGSSRIENGTLAGTSFSLSNSSSNSFSSSLISAGLAGAGASLEKHGAGKVNLSGLNTYTGTTTIHAGTLSFRNTGSLYGGNESSWTKENITVKNGGTFEVVVGGAGGFTIQQAKDLLTDLNTGVNHNGMRAGSMFSINLDSASGNQTFDQVISDSTGSGGGAIGFMNRGFNTLTINQVNTYTGPTIVGGNLAIQGAGTLGNQSDLIVGSPSFMFGTLNLGGTTQSVGDVTVHFGQIFNGSLNADSYTFHNGVISAGLGGAGANLVKGGTGSVYLSGINTYTGTTTIQDGTLHFEKSSALYNGDESKWTKSNITVNDSGTLAVSVGGTGEFTIHRAKNLLTELSIGINQNGLKSGSTFAIDIGYADSVIFDQSITDSTGTGGGAIGIEKMGDGTLILNQANSYSGATTLSRGTLALTGSGSLGNGGDLSVSADAQLDLGGTTQQVGAVVLGDSNGINTAAIGNGFLVGDSYLVQGGQISAGLGGAGANLVAAGGETTLSGTNTYTGQTVVNPGANLVLAKSASLYNGNTAQWTPSKISVGVGSKLTLHAGGVGEFSNSQVKTLINQITTSVNNNGLMDGSTVALHITDPGTSLTMDGVIKDPSGTNGGSLNFEKSGAGTLILDQSNTYTGETIVSEGTLVINGSVSTSYQTVVKDVAILAGSGSVGRLMVESGGTVSPGNSAGVLRTGDLTLDGTFAAEINGNGAGILYDQIEVTGTVNLSGLLSVTMGSFTPANGNLFFLINNDGYHDSVFGNFSGLSEGTEFEMAGQTWKISYEADFENQVFTGGNDVALMAIPEPGSIFLVTLGVIPVLRRNRRNLNSKSGSI